MEAQLIINGKEIKKGDIIKDFREVEWKFEFIHLRV
jgi:hypothetical protein